MILLVIISCRFPLPCIKESLTGEEWYALGKAMPLTTPTAVAKPTVAPVSRMDLKQSGRGLDFLICGSYESSGNKCLKIKNTAMVLQFMSYHSYLVKLDGNSLARNWRFSFHHELLEIYQYHQLNRLERCFNCISETIHIAVSIHFGIKLSKTQIT